MEHRFLLDGVDVDGGGKPVREQLQLPVFNLAYAADAVFAFVEFTVLVARLAGDTAVIEFF